MSKFQEDKFQVYYKRKKKDENGIDSQKRNDYQEHQKVIIKLFNNALEEEQIYIHLEEIDEEDNTVRFSILSHDLLEYDIANLNPEMSAKNIEKQDGYKPYFFTFVATINGWLKKYISKISDNFPIDDDYWFTASFKSEITKAANSFLEGYIVVAASPIQFDYKHRKLAVTDEKIPEVIRDSINNAYPLVSSDLITVRKKFANAFSDVSFRRAFIYKAGHANVIRLNGAKEGQCFNLIYDIGINYGKPGKKIKTKSYFNVKDAISHFKPNAVILSHWDEDHILGIVYANDKIYECPWFAPEVNSFKLNARRLARYLFTKNVLTLIEKDKTEKQVAQEGDLKIFMGRNEGTDGIDVNNCSGLVLVHEKADVKAIFCGDVPYKAIANELWNRGQGYDYLIIPHHARAMTVDGIVCSNPRNGIAIYCHKKKGDSIHIRELHRKHYQKIYKTEDASNNKYFSINLSKRGICK